MKTWTFSPANIRQQRRSCLIMKEDRETLAANFAKYGNLRRGEQQIITEKNNGTWYLVERAARGYHALAVRQGNIDAAEHLAFSIKKFILP